MIALTAKQIQILQEDCFADGTCRPDAILQMLQGVAGTHATQIGIGSERMLAGHNSLWMLARSWFRFDKPLLAGQTVTLETWPLPPDGLSSNRAFRFLHNGELLGEAFQVWLLVDATRRKILRSRDFPELQALEYCDRPAPIRLRKLHLPELQEVGECRVTQMDIDANGHMNNTRYLIYVMQVLGPRFVRELQINYDRECMAGDVLTLCRGHADGVEFVSGCNCEHAQSFETMLRFA